MTTRKGFLAGAAALVEHHHFGIGPPVCGIRREGPHRLHTGKGLEAIFAVEAAVVAFVLVRRAALLPRGPIVGIGQHRIGIAAAFRAPGRRGNIVRPGRTAPHHFRQIVVVLEVQLGHCHVVIGRDPLLDIAPAIPHVAALIVSAPEGDTGMVPQPPDIVLRLGQGALAQRSFIRINAATEHKVLPDQDAGTVAQFVEIIVFVHPAAPDAQHVHTGGGRIAHHPFIAFPADAGQEKVVRNIVGTLHKNRAAVYLKIERAALCVGIPDQPDRPETYFGAVRSARQVSLLDGHLKIVQERFPLPRRPPEPRIADAYRNLDPVQAGFQLLPGIDRTDAIGPDGHGCRSAHPGFYLYFHLQAGFLRGNGYLVEKDIAQDGPLAEFQPDITTRGPQSQP